MKIPTPLATVNFFTEKLDLYSFRARLASSVLSKKAVKCTKPSDYIDLCDEIFRHVPLKYIGRQIILWQAKQEIQALLSILSEQSVRSMLEIGTYDGGTLFLFTRMIDSNARIISLDMPKDGYENYKIPFFINLAKKNQHISLVRANSRSHSSLVTVKSILKGQKLDFLFIDGDHTYDGVKRDFQMYSPLVRKGGLIAFHDICKHPPHPVCEVDRFWNEIKTAHSYQEIIENPHQNWAGIGLLYI